MKRVHVRYRRSRKNWFVECDGRVICQSARTKWFAEAEARHQARRLAERGAAVQLLIHNRNGKIGKGGRSEASYNCDSPRRRG